MVKRTSKDGSGFQVETEYNGTTHIMTVNTKAEGSSTRVVLAGTFDGDFEEWADFDDWITAINRRYEGERDA